MSEQTAPPCPQPQPEATDPASSSRGAPISESESQSPQSQEVRAGPQDVQLPSSTTHIQQEQQHQQMPPSAPQQQLQQGPPCPPAPQSTRVPARDEHVYTVSFQEYPKSIAVPIYLGDTTFHYRKEDFAGEYRTRKMTFNEKPLWLKMSRDVCIYLSSSMGWCIGICKPVGNFIPVFRSEADKGGVYLFPPEEKWVRIKGGSGNCPWGIRVSCQDPATRLRIMNATPGQAIPLGDAIQRMLESRERRRGARRPEEAMLETHELQLDAALIKTSSQQSDTNTIEISDIPPTVTLTDVSLAVEQFCPPPLSHIQFFPESGKAIVGYQTTAQASEFMRSPPLLGGRSVQARMVSERGKEALQNFRTLLRNGCSEFVNPRVYDAVLGLAFEYAERGVEQVKMGHILIVGDWEEIKHVGRVLGMNDFEFHDQNILTKEGRRIVLVRMNHDLATVIDGRSGKVICNWFNIFSQHDEQAAWDNSVGGSAAGASASVAKRCPSTVVLKISTDSKGELKNFKGDRMTILTQKSESPTHTQIKI
uniref:Uncharacterized protein n=1 Tax=Chromera velia CCMP2878 TaxID=1169474 RepID=A0A0G4FZE3_9ALVE|eukprot:Cvel_3971.t1-p1 / transcript=Cvel_3971.t1 / gene=Cvel_3971 / organism=Chromera_velia_CCMP2878 / gene_product=hypothetical protein / transcript_product=hypothetical protein / location=Cvel_scaffold168:89724-91322(+) / protein_length=533 / sequence_SO=supercontig / SO=protein_coding / is_pseudo=false